MKSVTVLLFIGFVFVHSIPSLAVDKKVAGGTATNKQKKDTVKTVKQTFEPWVYKDTSYYFAPDFLKHNNNGFLLPFSVRDTVYNFEFYNEKEELTQSLNVLDDINFVSLLKTYIDSQNTYTDKHGYKEFLPVSRIINRYDRVDTNQWMCIDYSNNKYSRLIEFRNQVTGIDTSTFFNENKDTFYVNIFTYYKVKVK